MKDKNLVNISEIHDQKIPLKTLIKENKEVTLTTEQNDAVDKILNGNGVFCFMVLQEVEKQKYICRLLKKC